METQRTANTHLLECCGPPCHPGHGHQAPNGGSFPRPGSLVFASRVFAPVPPRAPWFLSPPLALSVLVLLRICPGRPWRLATLAPQGLGPGVPCLTAPVATFVSAVSPSFVGASCRVCCGSMSRSEDLRRLAAQLTVLAELEDSVAVGISRVLGGAGTAAGLRAASAATTAPPAASSTSLRELSGHEAATASPRAAVAKAASSRAPEAQLQHRLCRAWLRRPR